MLIDLSSNENPYAPSRKVTEAAIQGLKGMNRYVVPEELHMLRKALGEYCGVGTERILPGPGTGYLLERVLCSLAAGRELVVLNPAFLSCLELAARLCKRVVRLQLKPPSFKVDWTPPASGPALVILESPNNPTGQCLISREALKSLLKNEDCLVLIDEAGYEYAGKTFMDLIPDHPNLALCRTLDKAFGLAGLRVSWLVCGDAFMKALHMENVCLCRPALRAALAALEEQRAVLEEVKGVIEERERLKAALSQLGLEVFPSEANYLLVRSPRPDLGLLLRKRGILIADLSGQWFSGYFRISIGRPEAHQALETAVEDILRTEEGFMH